MDEEQIFKVVFTGAIGRANTIDNIVKLAENLNNQDIYNIKFYIFGDGPEKYKLEKYIKENKLNNIKF